MIKGDGFYTDKNKKENFYMRVKCTIFSIPLLLAYLLAPVFANQYFTNIKEELPYEYSFSQKYIIAGERVLNLTVSNNTAYNIKAIEFEIKLKNAFGEIISDWSTFTSPDLQIPSQSSKSLSLTLTKRNIFGAKIENVLNQARYVDLRYKRILIEDDILLKQRDLYSELQYKYGPFKIQLDVINNKNVNDPVEYRFWQIVNIEDSIATNLSILKKEDESKGQYNDEYRRFNYISQLVDTFSEDCLLLLVRIINITNEPQEKEWFSYIGDSSRYNEWVYSSRLYDPQRSLFVLVDDKNNQYNLHSIAYIPFGWSEVVEGDQVLYPNVTLLIVYIFDKIDSYAPKELKVYVDEQEYYKTFLRKDGKYIADNE